MNKKWIATALSIALSIAVLLPVHAGETTVDRMDPAFNAEVNTEASGDDGGQEASEPIERFDSGGAGTDADNLPDTVNSETSSPEPLEEDAALQENREDPPAEASSDSDAQAESDTDGDAPITTEEPAVDKNIPAAEETAGPAKTDSAPDDVTDLEEPEQEDSEQKMEAGEASSSDADSDGVDHSADTGSLSVEADPENDDGVEITEPPAEEEKISEEAMNTQYITGGTSMYNARSFSTGLGSGTNVIDNCKVVTYADAVQTEYWYKFSTSWNDSFYTIYFKNNSISNWVYFYLYDEDESQVWNSSEYSNQNSIEKLRLEPGSTYYIKVRHTGSNKGNFQFYVTEHYDDVDDDMYYAQFLNLGTRYVRGLQSWYDQDYFYFTTTSRNSFYAITFTNINMSAYIYARLETEDEEQLTYIDEYNNSKDTKYIKLRPNKTYYISVNKGSSYNSSKVGKYSLTVTELVDDCASTKGSAPLITRNKTRTGRINAQDNSSYPDTYTGKDEDWYKFKTGNLPKNYFYVKNLNADGYIYAEIQDQYGEIIWKDDRYKGGELRGNAILNRNSTYYLRIYGAKGNYKYRVSCRIPVTKVTLNRSSLDMYSGESYTLKATVYPSNASNKIVGWTSDDKSVATVSSSGRVYARSSGWATIYAITRDGGKRAACDVYVDW